MRVAKLSACLLFLFATSAWAQSFLGSINGTVYDATGAGVPQAKVALTETTTGVQRSTSSNDGGAYLFADLVPGTYSLTIRAAGFKEVKSSDIILTAQQVARFDANLEIGESSQTVRVEGSARNAQHGECPVGRFATPIGSSQPSQQYP